MLSDTAWMRIGVALGVVAAVSSLALAVFAAVDVRRTDEVTCQLKHALASFIDADASLRAKQARNALRFAREEAAFAAAMPGPTQRLLADDADSRRRNAVLSQAAVAEWRHISQTLTC